MLIKKMYLIKNCEYKKLGGTEVPFKKNLSSQKKRCPKLDYKSTAYYNDS